MNDLERLGYFQLYENDWDYSCGIEMEIVNGIVSMYEHDIKVKEPDCLSRILKVDLLLLLEIIDVNHFIEEMRKRFGRYDGVKILRNILEEKGIKYQFQEYYNMFIFWEHLSIRHHAQLNTSAEVFNNAILNWYGYSLCYRDERRMTYEGELPVFGPCYIHVDIPKESPICHVRIVSQQKIDEKGMSPMLEYMRKSMPIEPYYDDGGYRVLPKPHEIRLCWELPQGNVIIKWDGFNYTRGDGENHPQSDGLDYVEVELWDCSCIQRSRDEAFWRSEVD